MERKELTERRRKEEGKEGRQCFGAGRDVGSMKRRSEVEILLTTQVKWQ